MLRPDYNENYVDKSMKRYTVREAAKFYGGKVSC